MSTPSPLSARLFWLTGLSGAGKSTLALALQHQLREAQWPVVLLDGDRLRQGLCADLDFSPQGRRENLRRAAELSRLLLEQGQLVIAAFISPLRSDRAMVRNIVGAQQFVEVFVRCPLAVCQARDVKGLYKKANSGQIPQFTGISAPYEAPEAPSLTLDTETASVQACSTALLDHVLQGVRR
ncbi:adenylyl-sulfate kinase [Paucibacter sp. PLA-PC-4]|uniref:adenylyl-sulfate kinase n=1 Tax=Paucibacter sp. PLA-PC-4 TaxID=2993655 RepID=UPI002249097F|nr:adenylyl-sulfate kinase [Paucibacter sp. PLA-PC-4]MCX2863183.1 adenylyl-sulfate kinase [Paucibacter sp. PLA-PC-4]